MKNNASIVSVTVIAVVILICITVINIFSPASTAMVSILGFGGQIIVLILTSQSNRKNTNEKFEEHNAGVNEKLDVIHDDTNSNMSAVKEEMAELRAQLETIKSQRDVMQGEQNQRINPT